MAETKNLPAKQPDWEAIQKKSRDPREVEDFSTIPRWVKYAALQFAFLGLTRKEAANRVNRNEKTLDHWFKSPAVKQYITDVQQLQDDPVFMAQTLLKSNALDLTMDALMNLEAVKRAGDYKEVAVILRDLMDRAGVTKVSRPSQKIVLQIGSSSLKLDSNPVESSYEIIDAHTED